MTRLSRKEQKKYQMMIGSRVQVMHGNAHHTSGGLTKKHLFMNKNGRIVSKSKHFSAKKDNRLVKSGYGSCKGKFGYVKLKMTMKHRKSMRGGSMYSLSPSPYDGQGVGTSGPMVQIIAGQAGGRKTHGSRRHRRGGNGVNFPMSPEPYDGQGVGTSGVGIQLVAGQAGGKRKHKKGGALVPPKVSAHM